MVGLPCSNVLERADARGPPMRMVDGQPMKQGGGRKGKGGKQGGDSFGDGETVV